MDVEEVVRNLTAKCQMLTQENAALKAQIQIIADLKEDGPRGAETSRDPEHFTGQYTWEEANKQFENDPRPS